MKVKGILLQKKKIIDSELERLLTQKESRLFQAMRYSVFSGGKRYRPLLLLSSGECFNIDQSFLIPFACAIELIHNYSLIHDDLPSIDNDDYRRGKPTCHKAYGEDIAILAGDGLLSLAFEVMAMAPLPSNLCFQKEQAIGEISRFAGVRGMIEGQFMDISLSSEMITEAKMHELILKKTGALIMASVKAAAILGQASPLQLESISEYGKNIGLAFQIRDDILDSTQQEKKNALPRINYVLVFGVREAKRRLKKFVEEAIKALDMASLQSEELRYLALRLLELKSEN